MHHRSNRCNVAADNVWVTLEAIQLSMAVSPRAVGNVVGVLGLCDMFKYGLTADRKHNS